MVAENVENIRLRIASACARVHRKPEEITLIAVTKTFGSRHIREALAAGIMDFGENYVQELRQKRAELLDGPIRWHFIGHLQSNKVRDIAPWIECIHTVDSIGIGQEISRQASKSGRKLDILVETNTSGETSKFGAKPESTLNLIKELTLLPNVNVLGLMTIGLFLPDPEGSRPSFQLLGELKKNAQKEGVPLKHLSMGMTNDFEVAIEEGATMIRIGTAIFGGRTKQK
jgi:hypothetical protein